MDSRSRKRQASDTSLGLTDAPKAKRKKKVEKSSHSADLGSTSSSQTSTSKKTKSVIARPPPALYTPHPSQITESKVSKKSSSVASRSTTGAAATKSIVKSAEIKSEKKTVSHTEQTSSGSQSSTASNASAGVHRGAGTSSKPARPRRRNHLKPQNGSWKSHIASIVIYRCVGQALAQSFDPRGSIKEFNWDVLTDGLITPDDLKMIWFFIEREYQDVSLEDISEDLKPFSRLTMEPFLREEVKEKYKGEVPKPPVSAYLLFCKSKGPKLKEKHPELTRPQMAQTLGKRWKSMDAEKQAKYKQQYTKMREEYTAKMERFYEEHPDAKPSACRSRRRNDSKDIYLTPEEKRLKLLKSECPKPPLSAYMLFCKAKREKVHKKHPKLAAKEVTMKLSKKWKSMEEDEKIKYQRMHLESSSIYKEQLKEFHEKYPDAKELLKRKRKRKDSSSGGGSATSAVKSSTQRRDSHDTFYSSDEEESPLSLAHHAHSSEGAGDREGEISSSDDGGRSKVKGVRGERVNNERGTGGGKSESESESESSSSSEEEEGGLGGGGGKKLLMGQSRSKEKVASTPTKKSTSATVSHSSFPLKTSAATLGSSKAMLLSSRSTPSKKPIQSSSSSSESEDSGEETDLSDFM